MFDVAHHIQICKCMVLYHPVFCVYFFTMFTDSISLFLLSDVFTIIIFSVRSFFTIIYGYNDLSYGELSFTKKNS